jgi:hypothetical protein
MDPGVSAVYRRGLEDAANFKPPPRTAMKTLVTFEARRFSNLERALGRAGLLSYWIMFSPFPLRGENTLLQQFNAELSSWANKYSLLGVQEPDWPLNAALETLRVWAQLRFTLDPYFEVPAGSGSIRCGFASRHRTQQIKERWDAGVRYQWLAHRHFGRLRGTEILGKTPKALPGAIFEDRYSLTTIEEGIRRVAEAIDLAAFKFPVGRPASRTAEKKN